jgi:type IV pilus assembly protein PilE
LAALRAVPAVDGMSIAHRQVSGATGCVDRERRPTVRPRPEGRTLYETNHVSVNHRKVSEPTMSNGPKVDGTSREIRRASTRLPNTRNAPPRRASGFTMLEILITVAVVAIIAAVAMPSYIDYITRSKIVEATSNLNDMRVRLEQYFADNRAYPASCTAYAAGAAPAGKIYLPASNKYFGVTCAFTATTYTITATGSSTHGMAGFTYTIDEGNNRRTTSLPSGWSGAGSSSTCWVTRKNGSC